MGESGGYKYSHSRNKIKSHTQVDTQLHIKQWNIPVWIWNEILYCSQTYMCKLYFILSKDSFPILFKECFSIIYFSCKIWLLVQSDHSPTPIGYNMTYSFLKVFVLHEGRCFVSQFVFYDPTFLIVITQSVRIQFNLYHSNTRFFISILHEMFRIWKIRNCVYYTCCLLHCLSRLVWYYLSL